MSNRATEINEARQQLEAILSQDEYASYHKPPGGSFWHWLGSQLSKLKRFLPDIEVSAGTGKVLTYGLMALLLAAAGFAIYWFSKQLVRRKHVSHTALMPEGEISRSYAYYWQQASLLAEAGSWREGVRYTFLSLLFYLEAKQRIRVEKWKTNWEYAEELNRTEPGFASLFEESSLLFERIWYGQEDVAEEQFVSMYEQVAQAIGNGGGDQHARI